MEYAEKFWDLKCLDKGHTDYDDSTIYRYDQPLRLRTIRRMVRQLYPQGLKGKNALDIGCGTGDFVQLLLAEGASQVTGVDISPKVVEVAKKRFQAVGARVKIETAAIQKKLFEQQEVDLVTSITVLQHIIDEKETVEAVRNIAGVLSPNGYFIALEIAPGKEVPSSNSFMIRERMVKEWEELFLKAGMVLVERPLVYSPLGFCLLQIWIPSFLKLLFGKRWRLLASKQNMGSCESNVQINNKHGRAVLLRKAYSVVRTALLKITYSIDKLIEFKVPSSWSYYHVFILKRAA